MSDQPPMRKTQARAMERERARKQMERRDTISHALPFVIAAAVVLFVGITVFLLTNQPGSGAPRLQVDRDTIDLGKQIFDKPVRASFTVKNIGDGALKLDVPKSATLVEGC